MVRFCTEDYEKPRLKNLDNDYAHLTNFSLNKKHSGFVASENKKSLSSVFAELADLGVDVENVRRGINRIIRLTIIAGQPDIAASYHTGIFTNDGKSRCFEILGFDILLDTDARPWLLEVNCMPSLAGCSEFDEDLKTRVIAGALKIIDLDGSFRAKVLRRFKDTRSMKGAQSNPVFNPERESQLAKETEWEQLLPVVDDPEMAALCESCLTSVRDFGIPKKVLPAVQEPETPRRARPRAERVGTPKVKAAKPPIVPSAKQKIVAKPPPLVTKTPRSVVLANEARVIRLKGYVRRAPALDFANPIFQVFSPNENSCVVMEVEERDRILALKKQTHISIKLALGKVIRSIFPNGTMVVFPTEMDTLPQKQGQLFSMLKLVYA
jgi:tubulin polyglutamylase TTLL6/13